MWARRAPSSRAQSARYAESADTDPGGEDPTTSLQRLHDEIGDRSEASIQVLVAAADTIAEQWLDLRDRSATARAALEATEAAESVMRDRLRTLIDLIEGLPPVPEAAMPVVTEGRAQQGEPERPRVAAATRPHERSDSPDRLPEDRDFVERAPQADLPSGEDGAANPLAASAGEGLAVWLFGPMRVSLNGRRVDSNLHGKGLRVFRYLLAHRDRSVPKDLLIDSFWPESGLDKGRRGLHQAIYVVRRALRDEDPAADVVVFTGDAYEINGDLHIWCDVDEFELLIRRAHQAEKAGELRRASDLYRRAEQLRVGDFIEDAPYEDWAVAERERLQLAYIDATNRLGDLLERSGDLGAAVEVSQRLLGVESCDEESHRRLMRCYAAEGHRTLAARQYRVCAALLDESYGLAPSLETNELYFSVMND